MSFTEEKQSRKKTWLVSEYTWHLLFPANSLSIWRGREKCPNKIKQENWLSDAVGERLGSAQFSDLALTGCRVAPASPLAEWRSEERWTRGVWWEEPPLCRAHWADKEAGPQPWQWMRARLPWEYWTFMAERWRFSLPFRKTHSVRKQIPYICQPCRVLAPLPVTVFVFRPAIRNWCDSI